jgi:hypothetical protein
MEYPLIDRQLLASLRLAHGVFNLAVLLALCYQGWIGLKIRHARKAGAALPFGAIRRHRKSGPVLAALVASGYLFGIIVVFLDEGRLLEYPAHFVTGTVLVLLVLAGFILSRKIKGPDSPYRSPHFLTGIALLAVDLLQVFLGLGVLF